MFPLYTDIPNFVNIIFMVGRWRSAAGQGSDLEDRFYDLADSKEDCVLMSRAGDALTDCRLLVFQKLRKLKNVSVALLGFIFIDLADLVAQATKMGSHTKVGG
jgi:hypothetical protein